MTHPSQEAPFGDGISSYPANQARALGLVVGETIQGREEFSDTAWEETRLTLLWLGEEQAVWREQSRTSDEPEWSDHGEVTDWDLGWRQWIKAPSDSTPTVKHHLTDQAERDRFEAYITDSGKWPAAAERYSHAPNGYKLLQTATAWEVWQARARISAPQAAVPQWIEGEPANLAAAATDAGDWLDLIERLHFAGRWQFSKADTLARLRGCRGKLREFLAAPPTQGDSNG